MTHVDLEAEIRQTVQAYWRVRASLRLQAPGDAIAHQRLGFEGVVEVGSMSGLLSNESVGQAHAALSEYAATRLARDMFTALIAAFERRLVSRIVSGGGDGSGTLGALQRKVEGLVVVPQLLREDLVEVRERRNALIHHDGLADSKHVAAAALVHPRAPTFVPLLSVGTTVVPDGSYLTYAADVLVRYSAAL